MPTDDVLIDAAVARLQEKGGLLVALTGAGISAESGIPTFRGADGFWTRGSTHYQPEELATRAAFVAEPDVVLPWYLWRLGKCRQARPNAGHHAIVAMEHELGARFQLVTQNVDGLHGRAGSDRERAFHIHGELERMRCSAECSRRTWPVPDGLRVFAKGDELEASERPLLECPDCGAWARPHVLWFDEYYDEQWFRFDSTMRAAANATVLLVVGTAGATNLPMQMARLAFTSGALLIEVNLERTPFTAMAERSAGGLIIGRSGEVLPRIAGRLAG